MQPIREYATNRSRTGERPVVGGLHFSYSRLTLCAAMIILSGESVLAQTTAPAVVPERMTANDVSTPGWPPAGPQRAFPSLPPALRTQQGAAPVPERTHRHI